MSTSASDPFKGYAFLDEIIIHVMCLFSLIGLSTFAQSSYSRICPPDWFSMVPVM